MSFVLPGTEALPAPTMLAVGEGSQSPGSHSSHDPNHSTVLGGVNRDFSVCLKPA